MKTYLGTRYQCLTPLIIALSLIVSYRAVAACISPPSGLVSWWAAEGNTTDITGSNNGIFLNGGSFDTGEVGQAFSFSGAGNSVMIPASASLDVGSGPGFTVEAWIKTTGSDVGEPIVEWAPNGGVNGTYGVHFYANAFGAGALYANIFDADHQSHLLQSAAGVVAVGVYQHVAITYDRASGIGRLFANGAVVAEQTLGSFTPVTNPDLYIGYRPNFVPFGPISFAGDIDEVSVYARALSTEELQAIYSSGSAGKCTTPTPPAIYLQPTNQTAFVGQTVSFTVGASGTAPFSYQWSFNGTNIDFATNSSLTLTNVQLAQAGDYFVEVTNSLGSVTSIVATLTVSPPPPCVTPPTGLISWWQGEENAADETGLNNGLAQNGVTYSPGVVGQAFVFNGINSYIQISNNPSFNLANELTLELWYKDTGSTGPGYGLIAKRAPYPQGASFGINVYPSGSGIQVYLQDPHYFSYQTSTFQPAPKAGVFHHLAATYQQSTAEQVTVKTYVDGQMVNVGVLTGNLGRTLNTAPVTIGATNPHEEFFRGLIDEPSLYARALSASEILSIYSAGVSGKCPTPLPVGIYSQPADQTVVIGQTATFTVGVSGTQPISYQWTFNGSNIPGATDSSLVLTNVQRNQAGTYAVQVTNALASALSSNATLTVNFPPATVHVENIAAAEDGSVTVPITLVANGNENALGFSISFDPTLLSYVDAALANIPANTTLILNSNQAANGLVGIAISLPSDQSFTAGTQQVVNISFVSAVLVNPALAYLSFVDQPTKRQLSDPQANALAANFVGGTVSIPAANFEGDVSPRPNGDRAVSITDWVLVGRYAARLDYPTDASEYQRADCAPRSSLGDGAITVADWVQAGRYAAGLDSATRAGGPTNDVGPNIVRTTEGTKPAPKGSGRQVRVADVTLVQGQPGVVAVYLDAQGNESAVGFSLAFDPAALSYLSTSLGSDASAATLVINTNQAVAGHAAFVLEMPIGTSFAQGSKEILKLNLTTPLSTAGLYPVALTDQPVIRQVVDASAVPLATAYINGSVTLNPPPSLTVTRDQQNITLGWPLWATNFTLQQAEGPLSSSSTWSNVPAALTITNNAASVTLPTSGATRYFRLQK